MSLDVNEVSELRSALAKYRSHVKDSGDRQLLDATLLMIDEHLLVLESDEWLR